MSLPPASLHSPRCSSMSSVGAVGASASTARAGKVISINSHVPHGLTRVTRNQPLVEIEIFRNLEFRSLQLALAQPIKIRR